MAAWLFSRALVWCYIYIYLLYRVKNLSDFVVSDLPESEMVLNNELISAHFDTRTGLIKVS